MDINNRLNTLFIGWGAATFIMTVLCPSILRLNTLFIGWGAATSHCQEGSGNTRGLNTLFIGWGAATHSHEILRYPPESQYPLHRVGCCNHTACRRTWPGICLNTLFIGWGAATTGSKGTGNLQTSLNTLFIGWGAATSSDDKNLRPLKKSQYPLHRVGCCNNQVSVIYLRISCLNTLFIGWGAATGCLVV